MMIIKLDGRCPQLSSKSCGVFPSLAFNKPLLKSKLFVRYGHIQVTRYLIRGFFPVSLLVEVVLGSFAKYALHIHMYDYIGAIQC